MVTKLQSFLGCVLPCEFDVSGKGNCLQQWGPSLDSPPVPGTLRTVASEAEEARLCDRNTQPGPAQNTWVSGVLCTSLCPHVMWASPIQWSAPRKCFAFQHDACSSAPESSSATSCSCILLQTPSTVRQDICPLCFTSGGQAEP